jgi:hypothetical protein
MAYNISALSGIGPILSRRVQPQRAVKQARDYARLGYTAVQIVDVETGETHNAAGLAAIIQAKAAIEPKQ